MCLAVSLPSDVILKLLLCVLPRVYNAFNFLFFFTIDKVRRWLFEIRAMLLHLFIWR
jgi:hypothetical protein